MQIFPDTFSEYPNASPGEREIFRRLKSATRGTNWIVLHSLDLATHVAKSQSEADFILLVPGKGVLVLEVKAARTISYSAAGWKLGQKAESRGPFRQASDAKFSIMNYLKDLGFDFHDVPFVHAVWFTHIPRSAIDSAIAWQDDEFLTSEDLQRDIVEAISETVDNLVDGLKSYKARELAPYAKLLEISQILMPRFTAHQSPVERQRDIQNFLSTALKGQLEMVELIVGLRAVLIPGLAGTGKTHIAIHSARLAHERGERVLFICFNSMLAEHLKIQMNDFPLVRVTSIHALMLEISGLTVPEDADEDWWKKVLPNTALNRIEEYAQTSQFDTLVIDEAQDIGTQENLLLLEGLLADGLRGSRILACGDFEHQGVYMSGSDAISNYESAIPQIQITSPLLVNCRNTKMLGDFLVATLALEPAYSSYRREDLECELKPKIVTKPSEIYAEVSNLLSENLRKFRPEQIVVISAQKTKLKELVERMKIQSTEIRNPRNGFVRWGSVQEFKGLEALSVILVEFETANPALHEIFYVGATRSIYDFSFVMMAEKVKSLSKNLPSTTEGVELHEG